MKTVDQMKRVKEERDENDLSPITEKEWEDVRRKVKGLHTKLTITTIEGEVFKGRLRKINDITIEDYKLNIRPNAIGRSTILEIETLFGKVEVSDIKYIAQIECKL